MDLISRFPEHIIHDILFRLPDEDCARTCILSQTWRRASRPFIVFRLSHRRHSGITMVGLDKFMNCVDHCLQRFFEQESNSTPLLKFVLENDYSPGYFGKDFDEQAYFCRIDKLLQAVIDHGIKTLSVGISGYKLSSFLVSSQTLNELHLSRFCSLDECIQVKLPNLRVLSLDTIYLKEDTLNLFISGCPSMEVLRLRHCLDIYDLQISSLAQLVELSLEYCTCAFTQLDYENLSIASPSLRRLVIIHLDQEVTRRVQIDCPNLHSIEYLDNRLPFHSVSAFNPRHVKLAVNLLDPQPTTTIPLWFYALEILHTRNSFSTTKNLKVVLFCNDKVIILRAESVEVSLYYLYYLWKEKHFENVFCQRIFITSISIDFAHDIFPHALEWFCSFDTETLGFNCTLNIVQAASGASGLSRDLLENLSRTQESGKCWFLRYRPSFYRGRKYVLRHVKTDTSREAMPEFLSQYQSPPYQVTGIKLEWYWDSKF